MTVGIIENYTEFYCCNYSTSPDADFDNSRNYFENTTALGESRYYNSIWSCWISPLTGVLCNAMIVYANMICNLSRIRLGSNSRFPTNELWSRIWEVNETCGIKDIRLSHMTRTNEDTNLELNSQHANILYLIGYMICSWKKWFEARLDF